MVGDRFRVRDVRMVDNANAYDLLDLQTGKVVTIPAEGEKKEDLWTQKSRALLEQVIESRTKTGDSRAMLRVDIGEKQKGELLFDSYRIQDIRHGTVGIVYVCEDEQDHEVVAIKTFTDEFRWCYPSNVSRFWGEANTYISLEPHPNVVSGFYVHEIYGRLHILMEYLDGGSLRDLLRVQSLQTQELLQISLDICYGLQFIHSKNLVHCDVKPENILLASDHRAKIADLGLALQVDDGEQKRGGTPGYQAPEQRGNKNTLAPSMDIYALGMVILEMFLGRYPEKNISDVEIKNQIPYSNIAELLIKMTSSRAHQRPTLDLIITALSEVYQKVSGDAYQPLGTEKAASKEKFSYYFINSLIILGRNSDALTLCDQWLQTSSYEPSILCICPDEHLAGVATNGDCPGCSLDFPPASCSDVDKSLRQIRLSIN